jgi:hypothetical protein
MSDWLDWLDSIKTEFVNNKKSFLRQKNISRTVHPSVGGRNIYSYVKSTNDYLDKLRDPDVGDPIRSIAFEYSLPAVESAYHITKLQEFFKILPKQLNRVTDVGGGYGYLCYSFNKLGFKGNYTICDFDVMNSIQNYYLKKTLGKGNYNCVNLNDDNLHTNEEESLLLGTFSISEMPLSDRKIIEPHYQNYKYIMIIYKDNANFGVDNKDYFNGLKESLSKTHKITDYKCPLRKNDYYLLGEKL